MITLTIRTPDTVQAWQLQDDEADRRMNFLKQFHKPGIGKYQYEFAGYGRVIEDLRLPPMCDVMDELRLRKQYPGGSRP